MYANYLFKKNSLSTQIFEITDRTFATTLGQTQADLGFLWLFFTFKYTEKNLDLR